MNSSDRDGRASAQPVRLTTDGRCKRDPVFWPGGKELIYSLLTPVTQMSAAAAGLEGRFRLMRLHWTDRSVTPFHSKFQNQSPSDRELAVAADGTVYAYSLVKGMGEDKI